MDFNFYLSRSKTSLQVQAYINFNFHLSEQKASLQAYINF